MGLLFAISFLWLSELIPLAATSLVIPVVLVLMDIQLPGIDGTEAMKQIRQTSQRHVPIIALTANATNKTRSEYLSIGMDEYMTKPVKKIEDSGNHKILLTERGYTFGYNDLVVDPRSIYHLAETGYPVIFDITHSIRKYGIPSADPTGGARQYLDVLARAGVASGIDGIFVEAHPCPAEALCDAASQYDLNELEEFIKPLIEIHELEVKYRK